MRWGIIRSDLQHTNICFALNIFFYKAPPFIASPVLISVNNAFVLQIYYYADSIYASAGVNEQDIQYVTVGTGAVNLFMTIAAVSILKINK